MSFTKGGRKPGPKRRAEAGESAEPSMTVVEFNKLVGGCSEEEIDRLRSRYKRYYREHREVFADLLYGKFTDNEIFKRALLDARVDASARGMTSAERLKTLTRTSSGGFGRANERKFIKLATRILYLRMTGGQYRGRDGRTYDPWPLPCDSKPAIPAAAAKKRLVAIMELWGVKYDTIRKTHTPFQDER